MTEPRALNAALSGPVFQGAATRSALHASERHVDRWAPEGTATTRSRGLGTLAFADRVAAPWMTTAMESRGARMLASPAGERATPQVSWLFPRPWFQDELDWMASARQAAEARPQFLTTRGTYESARSSPRDVAMPMIAPELVAPSLAAGWPAMPPLATRDDGLVTALDAGAAPVHGGLRAWSPSVPFAAAAAEVIAGAVTAVSRSGLSSVAERSPIVAGLTMVTPAALASASAGAGGRAATLARALAEPSLAVPSATTSVSSATSSASPSSSPSPTSAGLQAAIDAIARVDEQRRSAVAPAASTSAATDAATAVPPPEQSIAAATAASPPMASALRTIDLLLHAAVPSAGGEPTATLAPTVGPRVAMPVGLGGLVTSLGAAQAVSHPMARMFAAAEPAAVSAPSARAPFALPTAAAAAERVSMGATASAGSPMAATAAPIARAFAPVWAQPTTALGAIASEPARAVDHLAWSDRWLARFAGASPVALAALDAAHGQGAAAPRTLSPAAPETVYLRAPFQPRVLADALAASSVVQPIAPRPAAPAPARPASPERALRIDDGEAVPDDVFAAIAAAAVTPARAPRAEAPVADAPRVAADAPRATTVEPPVATLADRVRGGARPTIADLIAVAAPPAPDAGLAAGLASSPMAPAIAGVLPLPVAPTFDPRSLFTDTVGAAYLGGLLARAAAPIGVIAGAPTAATLAGAGAFGSSPVIGGADAGAWSRRDLAMTPLSLRLAAGAPSQPMVITGGDVDITLRRGGLRAGGWDGAVAPFAAERAVERPDQPVIAPVAGPATARGTRTEPTGSVPFTPAPSIEGAPSVAETPTVPSAATIEPELLALRSALLAAADATSVPLAHATQLPLLSAPTVVPTAPMLSAADAFAAGATVPGSEPSAAARRAPALSLPSVAGTLAPIGAPGFAGAAASVTGLAGELAAGAPVLQAPAVQTSTGRPGALAELALAWSVAEERAAADLSFDFVAPEMVLAAKVYGLSPAVAAQAARLAVAGPSAMASLATSLDLTFLRAFHQASTAPASGAARAGAAPAVGPDGAPALAQAPALESGAGSTATSVSAPSSAAPVAGELGPSADVSAPGSLTAPATPGTAARLPRGAFLWPSAAVAALGLKALSPEGVAGMPVVALELLAAAAVADLGTWVTAFPGADPATIANVLAGGRAPVVTPDLGAAGTAATGIASITERTAARTAGVGAASPADVAGDDVAWPELGGAGPATADARARFQAIYVALAQSSDGQSLSPSARAARAMALLARGDDAPRTAHERALAAWSVLPQVYQGGLDVVAPSAAHQADGGTADLVGPDLRPGLSGLAARAGESLGSFVAPSGRELATAGGFEERPRLADRVDAPVYVNTSAGSAAAPASADVVVSQSVARPGRTFSQVGGGEPEIPTWFEAAARRMLDQQTPGSGMSLAELVLVTAMPSRAIAAATRGASAAPASSAPAGAGSSGKAVEKPDVDKIAHEVYLEVLKLIDIARERSGDPFQ